MGDRKTGHEQFRNLFKAGSREQTSVNVANKANAESGRSRPSNNANNSPFKNVKKSPADGKVGMSCRSSKSVKKMDKRNKPSGKKTSGQRKKGSANVQTASENSNRRGSKERIRTPTTPPFVPGSKARTPKKNKPAKPRTPGAESMCVTVFENDAGLAAAGGGATIDGGRIQLAAAKIKERKLQWKKEGLSPVRTDPAKTDTRQQTSSEPMSEGETEKAPSKEEKPVPIRHEANVTVRDRTIFENDDNNPALVKEEKRELQWAPGAAQECMSEPAVRKKKSLEDKPRGATSDRPPREQPPVKPPRNLPALIARTPPQAPIRASPVCGTATTPTSLSPRSSKHKPLRLEPTAWAIDQKTNPHSTTGSTDLDGPPSPADKPVSCYLAPNMQQAQFTHPDLKNSGQVDSEPYDIAPPTPQKK